MLLYCLKKPSGVIASGVIASGVIARSDSDVAISAKATGKLTYLTKKIYPFKTRAMRKLLRSGSEGDTQRIGLKLGKLLGPGDTVFLTGGLGCGKTTLVKGIAGAFGIDAKDITSASFTIIAEHEGTVPLYHIDLYRLDSLSAIDDIGLYEYIGTNGVTVIEWADRLQGTETATVTVDMEYVSENEREITLEGVDDESWSNL